MENKFQTSFIPRKPMTPVGGAAGGAGPIAPKRHIAGSLFVSLSTVAFVISVATAAGAFVWNTVLLTQQDSYKVELQKRENLFKPNTIQDLKNASIKLNTAKKLISDHLAVSQIFNIISLLTTEKVRFTSLDLVTGLSDGININLKGSGFNFSTVAWQSDVLNKLQEYGLHNIVKNPVLSDPTPDQNGTVTFNLSAAIDPKNILYDNTASAPTSASSPTSGSSSESASSSPFQ